MRKNQQNLKLEAAYLKDINHTLKELHQSREQVYHYQKLQTIGALAGGIVHEFNNLLTAHSGLLGVHPGADGTRERILR